MFQFLVFLIGLSFVLYPFIIGNGKTNFVDNYILFCLYFDLVDVFLVSEEVIFVFSQYIILLGFTVYYFYKYYSSMKKIEGAVFTLSIAFLFINLLTPLLHGSTLKTNFIDTSKILSSFAILPIAFHHYATRGNIINLFRKAMIFSYLLVSTILLFTVFRIDSNYVGDSGLVWMSADELEQILYFGNFGVRGGFTYIGFLVLLFPLFFAAKIRSRQFTLILLGFILVMMALSFKRFAFVIVFTGLLVYILSNLTSLKLKFRLLISSATLILILVFLFDLGSIVSARFEARGGASGVGMEAIENDVRFFEIGYAFQEVSKNPFTAVFGQQSDRKLYLDSFRHGYGEWSTHNQYAQYLLKFGMLGLLTYTLLLWYLYQSTKKMYLTFKKNLKNDRFIDLNWLLFKALIITFIMAGFIGGLDKITIRGIVFVFLGAISGSFYKRLHSVKTATVIKNELVIQ